MIPTTRDVPTTWAGLAPTHSTRPAEYQAAIDAADAVWLKYYDYCDAVYGGGKPETETEPAEYAELTRLLALANAAEDAKAQAYQEWQAQLAAEYVREPSQYDEHSGAFLP